MTNYSGCVEASTIFLRGYDCCSFLQETAPFSLVSSHPASRNLPPISLRTLLFRSLSIHLFYLFPSAAFLRAKRNTYMDFVSASASSSFRRLSLLVCIYIPLYTRLLFCTGTICTEVDECEREREREREEGERERAREIRLKVREKRNGSRANAAM